MAEEVGIVMSLYDRVSPTLKTIAGNTRAFDKNLDDLEESLKAGSPREAIAIFVAQAVSSGEVITHLLASQYGHELSQLMQKAVRAYLWHIFGHMFPNSQLSVADTEVALDFFTGGITGLILGNYAKRNLDTDALVDQIYRLLSGEMRAALLGEDTPAAT